MSTHVIQIGKHRFACGLFWQSLSRPRDLMKEAAELARKIDSDLVVLRKDHATAQAGFGHTREFSRKTCYSLGAAVSKTIAVEGAEYDGQKQPAHNWLGAFKLPDGKWAYFAVRDANFLPNGDFAGSKEDVIDRLHNDYSMGGWNVVIGDVELEHLGFHNFMPRKIEEMIPHKRGGQLELHSWWTLRPLKRAIPWRPIVVGFGALLVCGGGYAAWRYDAQKKDEELRRRLLLEMAQNAKKQEEQLLPWQTASTAASLTRACVKSLDYLTAGGWKLDNYLCTSAAATYMWSREGSTVGFLLSEVPDANVDLNGNKAALIRPLHVPNGGKDALLPSKDLVGPLVSRLQLLDITPKIDKVTQSPTAGVPGKTPTPGSASAGGPNAQNKIAPKPEWETYAFSFNAGALPPNEIAQVLSRPGVRLSKLTYHNQEWSFEGVMYAKLP